MEILRAASSAPKHTMLRICWRKVDVTHQWRQSPMMSLTNDVTHQCRHSPMMSLTNDVTHQWTHSPMTSLTNDATHQWRHSPMTLSDIKDVSLSMITYSYSLMTSLTSGVTHCDRNITNIIRFPGSSKAENGEQKLHRPRGVLKLTPPPPYHSLCRIFFFFSSDILPAISAISTSMSTNPKPNYRRQPRPKLHLSLPHCICIIWILCHCDVKPLATVMLWQPLTSMCNTIHNMNLSTAVQFLLFRKRYIIESTI